jgi:hypothetical protein
MIYDDYIPGIGPNYIACTDDPNETDFFDTPEEAAEYLDSLGYTETV